MSIALVSYVWANRLATSENMVVHWCKHYVSAGIDAAHICLNVSGKEDDSELFKMLIQDNIPGCNITIHRRSFSNGVKIRFMNSIVCDGRYSLIVPADIDEFIDYDLRDSASRLLASEYPAIHGRLVDMVCLHDGKLCLNKPALDKTMLEQFPEEANISSRIKRGMNKVVLVKKDIQLHTGHHWHKGFRHNPAMPGVKVKVRHYCWTDTSLYNRSMRKNSGHPIYKKLVKILST